MSQLLTYPSVIVDEKSLLSNLVTYQMMPQLIRESIIDRAIELIQCTTEEVAQACETFYQSYQITTEAKRQAWLERYSMTATQLELAAVRPLKIEKYKQQTWGQQLIPYFLKRKEQLDRIVYSCIRLQDGNIAQELFFRIDGGEQSFSQLAHEYSEGLESITGGIIGPVEMSRLAKPLATIFRGGQPGQLWRPIALEKYFVILRLEKFISAQLDTVTQQRLLNELFEDWLQKQLVSVSNKSEDN